MIAGDSFVKAQLSKSAASWLSISVTDSWTVAAWNSLFLAASHWKWQAWTETKRWQLVAVWNINTWQSRMKGFVGKVFSPNMEFTRESSLAQFMHGTETFLGWQGDQIRPRDRYCGWWNRCSRRNRSNRVEGRIIVLESNWATNWY